MKQTPYRRELRWMLLIWAALFLWVIGYCGSFGYGNDASSKITFGMPSWVVWGVLLPWLVATFTTCWFALFVMKDDVDA